MANLKPSKEPITPKGIEYKEDSLPNSYDLSGSKSLYTLKKTYNAKRNHNNVNITATLILCFGAIKDPDSTNIKALIGVAISGTKEKGALKTKAKNKEIGKTKNHSEIA